MISVKSAYRPIAGWWRLRPRGCMCVYKAPRICVIRVFWGSYLGSTARMNASGTRHCVIPARHVDLSTFVSRHWKWFGSKAPTGQPQGDEDFGMADECSGPRGCMCVCSKLLIYALLECSEVLFSQKGSEQPISVAWLTLVEKGPRHAWRNLWTSP